MKDRSNAFLEFLKRGLKTVANKRANATLGDRSLYIGASDISKGCLRQAVFDKIIPPSDDEASLSHLLTTERGHWQEAGLLAAFNAGGAKVIHQLEIANKTVRTSIGTSYRFHLDFVLVSQNKIIIVESKSFKGTPPDTPYDSHLYQLHIQIAALKKLFTVAAFRVPGMEGFFTFPDLVKKLFGAASFRDDIDVEGWLLCIGSDKGKVFGPYNPIPDPSDPSYWLNVMSRVDNLNDSIAAKKGEPIRGVYPLCDYCRHASTCPKFKGPDMEDFAEDVERLINLKEEIRVLEAKANELKDSLSARYAHIPPDNLQNGKWVRTSKGGFMVGLEKRSCLKKDKLISTLKNHGLAQDRIDEILERSSDVSEYQKFLVSKVAMSTS